MHLPIYLPLLSIFSFLIKGTSFATDGIPNYDGSKAEWHPWHHKIKEFYSATEREANAQSFAQTIDWKNSYQDNQDNGYTYADEHLLHHYDEDDQYLSEYDEEELLQFEEQHQSPNFSRMHYRSMALDALDMEVIDEDALLTSYVEIKLPRMANRNLPRSRALAFWGKC